MIGLFLILGCNNNWIPNSSDYWLINVNNINEFSTQEDNRAMQIGGFLPRVSWYDCSTENFGGYSVINTSCGDVNGDGLDDMICTLRLNTTGGFYYQVSLNDYYYYPYSY